MLIGTSGRSLLPQVRIDAVHNRDVVLLLNMDSNDYQFEQLSMLLLLQRFEAKPFDFFCTASVGASEWSNLEILFVKIFIFD